MSKDESYSRRVYGSQDFHSKFAKYRVVLADRTLYFDDRGAAEDVCLILGTGKVEQRFEVISRSDVWETL